MLVRFKKLVNNAVQPAYAKPGDAGLDLVATSREWSDELQCYIYGTGIAVEIPEGYVGFLVPRSSLRKYGLIMANHIGTIDSGYRGEIFVTFRPATKDLSEIYKVGDKIAQLIIMRYPIIEMLEVDELSDSVRGTDGHGSTGR